MQPEVAWAGAPPPALTPAMPGAAVTAEAVTLTTEPPRARTPYALLPAPIGVPLFTVALITLTDDAPVTKMPVASGPTPPPTRVRGLSLLPIVTPVEAPVTSTPVALPLERRNPKKLIPLTLELLTPLTVRGLAVLVPDEVVTSAASKLLKSCL